MFIDPSGMPKFSVITVVLNGAVTLRDTIHSVLSQQNADFEYIIQDGGSTDGTIDIIREFKDERIVFLEKKDEGLYDAMNQALDLARGEFIAFLHSDDIYSSAFVLHKVSEVFDSEQTEIVYADLKYVDRTNPARVFRTWKSGKFERNSFLWGWMPPHPAFFVRREMYLQYGKFNTDFHFAADYELMLRFMYRYSVSVAYLPDFVVYMKSGGKSNRNWRNRFLANREDKKAWQVNNISPYFITFILKPLRKFFQFF